MPSHIMDHRHLSSLFMPSAPSSFFIEDLCLPSEGQLGFWKAENLQDQFGIEGMPLMSGSKSLSSSPLEKLHPVGGNFINYLELPRTFISMEQKERISAENHLLGSESTLNLSMTSLEASNQDILPQTNLFQQPEANGLYYENGLFLGFFPEAFGKKVGLWSSDGHFGKSLDATDTEFKKDEPLESLKEVEAQTIGDLLPNDDDLLSGVIDNTELVVQANSGNEDDLFYSGGGMELESDESFNCKRTSGFVSAGASNSQIDDMNNKFPSELTHGKHSSRTLILRNIDSKVDEAELKILFEQFGEIRVLHMASKHQGFVLVSYYDIRASNNAIRSLQNKLLRQRKIDIHYYFSKDNASDINVTHATLVVSNLDSSFTNDDVHQIFGSFGEIKEIFYNPHYQNQRAMEFYDVRAAEAALCALNMSDIAGKRIKVEPCCPGVVWSLGKLSPLELGKEGSIICRNGDSSNNPLLEIGASSGSMCVVNTSVGLDNRFTHSSPLQTYKPFMERKFTGISSNVPHSRSSPDWVAMMGNHCNQSSSDELSNSLGQMNFAFRSISTIHSHSLPEFHDGLISGIPFKSVSSIQPTGTNNNSRIADVMDNQHNRGGSGHINSQSFELKEDFGIPGKESFPINEHQYVLNNSNADFHQPPGSLTWQNSPSSLNSVPAPPPRLRRLPRGPSHMLNTFVPLNHHHVGSAPALIPSIWERCSTYAGDCMEATSFYPGSLGNMGFCVSPQMPPLGFASHSIHSHAGRNCMDPSISLTHIGSPSPQQRSHMFHGRNRTSSLPSSYDAPGERSRTRQIDAGANQTDNKKRFELDIDRIISGEDSRTTLMIKNIPNKYTSKMLLATIDEHHKGTYDFIYLPIDFKNKCNVGYAFINLTEPKNIIPFHQAYNGKKWEKFNSEKVASLAYARIQGKAALVAHFQNSSLMNEDKRCRPILFHSDGPNAGDQEPFPLGTHIRSRPGRSRISNNEEHHQRSPSDSCNGDDSNSTDSSSSAIKDSEGSESSFTGTLTTKK